MFSVYVTGLTEMMKMLKRAESQFPDMIESTMEHACTIAKTEAERLCPVDSGELRDSIYCKHDEKGFELGATAKHVVFNEYGCYNIKVPGNAKYYGQRPFIRPAMYKAMEKVPDTFSKNWEKMTHG